MEICSKLEKKVDCSLNQARENAHIGKENTCLSGRKTAIKVFVLELMALISRIVRLPLVIAIIQPFRVVVFTTTLLTFRLIKPLNRLDSHLPGLKDIYHTSIKIPRLFIGFLSTGVFGIFISPEANFKIHYGIKLLRKEVEQPGKDPKERLESSRIDSLGNLEGVPETPKNLLEFAKQQGIKFTRMQARLWVKMPVTSETKNTLRGELEVDPELGEYDPDLGEPADLDGHFEDYEREFEEEDSGIELHTAVKRDLVALDVSVASIRDVAILKSPVSGSFGKEQGKKNSPASKNNVQLPVTIKANSEVLENSKISSSETLKKAPGTPKNLLEFVKQQGKEVTPRREKLYKKMPVTKSMIELLNEEPDEYDNPDVYVNINPQEIGGTDGNPEIEEAEFERELEGELLEAVVRVIVPAGASVPRPAEAPAAPAVGEPESPATSEVGFEKENTPVPYKSYSKFGNILSPDNRGKKIDFMTSQGGIEQKPKVFYKKVVQSPDNKVVQSSEVAKPSQQDSPQGLSFVSKFAPPLNPQGERVLFFKTTSSKK